MIETDALDDIFESEQGLVDFFGLLQLLALCVGLVLLLAACQIHQKQLGYLFALVLFIHLLYLQNQNQMAPTAHAVHLVARRAPVVKALGQSMDQLLLRRNYLLTQILNVNPLTLALPDLQVHSIQIDQISDLLAINLHHTCATVQIIHVLHVIYIFE